MRKIEIWLEEAFSSLNKSGNTFESIHIDEFLESNFTDFTQEQQLVSTIDFFNKLTLLLREKKCESLLCYIDISLKSEGLKLDGVMSSYQELIESIDKEDVPELFFVKRTNPSDKPELEFYKSPLPFKLNYLNEYCFPIYKEYRTLSDFIDKEPFNRELTIIYSPNKDL